jgi:2-polyprenyl-3-methyl-5-hydroxy-6-metoxy-1,4-benzoquinol methylase
MRVPSASSALTPAKLSAFFFDLYDTEPRALRTLIAARPYVCPYDKLISFVPQGATVLDLGCGTGTLLATLAAISRLHRGIGCDVAEPPLHAARVAAERIGSADILSFESVRSLDLAPAGPFDVVLMVDVLHHIPVPKRADAIRAAAQRTAAGGVFIYKDMTDSPTWRRVAHTIDDLIFSHELVTQVRAGEVEAWAGEADLAIEHSEFIPRLVYGHQLRVFRKS